MITVREIQTYNIHARFSHFREGFFRVNLNEKGWNFINTEGQIAFPNQQFDFVDNFREGFAKVYLDGKGYNFINTEGQFLSPNQWFDFVYVFHEGFAKVELDGNLDGDDYFLDTEGNLYDKDRNLIRNLRTESRFYKSSLIENYNNMKKQLIRLTEGDLHKIIKESVKRILSENGDDNIEI